MARDARARREHVEWAKRTTHPGARVYSASEMLEVMDETDVLRAALRDAVAIGRTLAATLATFGHDVTEGEERLARAAHFLDNSE